MAGKKLTPEQKAKAKEKREVAKSDNWQPTPQQIIAAHKLADPDVRMTKEKIAEAAGVSRKTLYEWFKDERFNKYCRDMLDRYMDAEVAEVWKALIRNCKMGKDASIKLYFEMKGQYSEKKKFEHSGPGGKPIEGTTTFVFKWEGDNE